MSGIVGILNLDGAPVDRQLLQQLTEFQTFRGPDARNTWVSGNVGLGHALLKTNEEAEREHQPFTLGDDVWIVADARVDARQELVVKLQSQGHKDLAGISDAELILRAYQVWNEDCVEHLLGDFAFAIWDGRLKQLFCARDHMGVKCFYYAHVGNCLIFSNTLDCVRRHPLVSDLLNDLAIADFLLFEMNLDQETTSFADIHRLAPAHRAVWSSDGFRRSRYWKFPIEEPSFYRRASDYTDQFKELMDEAVGDRLRTPRVGILMSGGLDSPTIAAFARKLSREKLPPIELRAFTMTTRFGPDEGYYAEMVARTLDIPIECRDWEEDSASSDWEQTQVRTSEPSANTYGVSAHQASWKRMGSYCRVFLQGEGPDNALVLDWRPYVSYLLRQKRYGRLFRDSCQYLAWHRRIPFWGKLSRSIRKNQSEKEEGPSFPEWIDSGIESRLALRARWDRYFSPPPSEHPIRPLTYALLNIPGEFQDLFRSNDAGVTMAPVDVRYPFMDLRLLRFFLAIPPIPWCRSKYLLRRAMKGMLPDPVLRRPKEGVPNAVNMENIVRGGLGPLKPAPGFASYVDAERLPNIANKDPWNVGIILRARLLNHWLQNSRRHRHNSFEEVVSYERYPESAP